MGTADKPPYLSKDSLQYFDDQTHPYLAQVGPALAAYASAKYAGNADMGHAAGTFGVHKHEVAWLEICCLNWQHLWPVPVAKRQPGPALLRSHPS